MKKVLAIVLAVLVAFSAMVIPACAVDAEEPAANEFAGIVDSVDGIYGELKEGEYETALDSAFALIEDLYNLVHNLIGSILAVAGKECGVCGEVHAVAVA